jgi:hypothetical protein
MKKSAGISRALKLAPASIILDIDIELSIFNIEALKANGFSEMTRKIIEFKHPLGSSLM